MINFRVWLLISVFIFSLFSGKGFAYKEKDINENLLEDEEIIQYLDFLDNLDYMEEDLTFIQEYDEAEQYSNAGDNNE